MVQLHPGLLSNVIPFSVEGIYSTLDQENKFTFDFYEDCFSLAHASNIKNHVYIRFN